MRLIDADRLKTTHEIQMGNFNSMESVREWIDRQPTAYDVEAVVRELEERAEYYNKAYYRHHDDEDSGRAFAYECAIDVVKRGGRNDRI